MYAYLRSQEGRGDALADTAIGLLLHPSIGQTVDETVVIQEHPIRFATVDLTASPGEIRASLLNLCDENTMPPATYPSVPSS
jgi:5-methylcytosine-specific restriction enzyme subunit McrC